MPRPGSLVVKNGSNTRATVSPSIPSPVSWTETQRYSPGSAPSASPAARAHRWVSTRMPPPGGVASRALTTRFMTAASNWLGSMQLTASGAPDTRVRVTASPTARRSRGSLSGQHLVDAHTFRLQGLPPREGEELLGQALAAPRPRPWAASIIPLAPRRIAGVALNQVERPE